MVTTTTSTTDLNSLTQMQDFKDGKVNITKSDLKSSIQSSISNGKSPSSVMVDIIDSYDKIDTNGDGISYKELTTYKNSTAGILSSMGLSSNSIKQKEMSMVADAFLDSDSSSDDLSSFLLSSNKLSFSTTQAINNYLSGLNTTTSTTAYNTDTNILDLLS